MKTTAKKSQSADFVPEITHFGNLDETERAVARAILEKRPGDTWEQVAKSLGISRRQLFNLRARQSVRTAVLAVSRDMLTADAPDVFKALTIKAKSGDSAAMKLFFELLGEFKDPPQKTGDEIVAQFWRELQEFNMKAG